MQQKESETGQRERLKSRLGFIMLSAGCVIGCGNVWKFPWMCGTHGGGVFVLIYVFFLLMLGLPAMTMEFTIGRAAQTSPVRLFQEGGIAVYVSNVKQELSALAHTQYIARSAQSQIFFCNIKPVIGMTHDFQPVPDLLLSVALHKNTIGLDLSSPDPSAQLVQLSQTEPLGVFNHHDSSIRNIDAHFYDCRGNKDLYISFRKALHDFLFFIRWHPAVQSRNFEPVTEIFPKHVTVLENVLTGSIFARFNHRTDYIYLPSLQDLFFNELVCSLSVFRPYNAVLYRQTFGGKFIQHGDIQITIQNHRQCARDRSCTHNQYVRSRSLGRQHASLSHSEPMLFIRYDKTKSGIGNRFLNQGMCAYDHTRFSF